MRLSDDEASLHEAKNKTTARASSCFLVCYITLAPHFLRGKKQGHLSALDVKEAFKKKRCFSL